MKNFSIKKNNSVVFVIDMQDSLLKAMNNKERTLKFANIILEAAKTYSIPVIYTEQYPKGLGKTCTELMDKIENLNNIGFEKTQYNAYLPEVSKALKDINKKQVVLIGIEAHICVFQTIRALIENEYEVFVPFDAVDSRNEENYKNGLEMAREMGSVISNTESILFDLMKDAKDPHFKELQALIK